MMLLQMNMLNLKKINVKKLAMVSIWKSQIGHFFHKRKAKGQKISKWIYEVILKLSDLY